MSREIKFNAIILKKQAFGEGDEIITFFTKEQGKIRCLAKAVKKPLSKLQQKLQVLFLVEIWITTGAKLPKIIRVEPLKVFSKLREDLDSIKFAFLAIELILKFTADGQKNEPLYNLFLEFIEFLNSENNKQVLGLALAKFKIGVLQASGLAVDYPSSESLNGKVFFSADKGGFSASQDSGSLEVPGKVLLLFTEISQSSFKNLIAIENFVETEDLQRLLSQFIEYQLERKLKSEKFLNQ